MKKVLTLLFAGMIAASVFAQDRTIKFSEGKWAELVALAKKENKPIFVDCFTTWCGPCKWLAKNVFTKNEVADFYNGKYISVEIDMEKGEGIDLAKQWNIRAYPSLIFCDANGEVTHRSCGVDYRDDFYKDFIQLGKDATDPSKQFAVKKKLVESGKADAKTTAEYILLLSHACQDYDAELKKYFATQKDGDLISRQNWDLIYNVVSDFGSREFTYLVSNKALYDKLYTADSVTDKINSVMITSLLTLANAGDQAQYDDMKMRIKKSGIADPDKIILMADMKLYQKKKDWTAYANTAIAYTDKYSMNNANELNSVAWNFYEKIEDKTLLANAERWAKRSVELDPNYANTDTYAAVLFKLGKIDEAKKQAQIAIDLAKKENTNYSETQKLLDKMNGIK